MYAGFRVFCVQNFKLEKWFQKIFPRIAGPVVDLFVSLECIFHDESECCNLDLYLENFMKMLKKIGQIVNTRHTPSGRGLQRLYYTYQLSVLIRFVRFL